MRLTKVIAGALAGFALAAAPAHALDAVQDQSFEALDPAPPGSPWSMQTGAVACQTTGDPCVAGFGARTGEWFVVFPGTSSTASQQIAIAPGATTLTFHIRHSGLTPPDALFAYIDGTVVRQANLNTVASGMYVSFTAPISTYADGGVHTLSFTRFSAGGVIALDDVSIPVPDADNDAVADSQDNCASTANSDQANADGDGPGNACDEDDDNDGATDAVDVCPQAAGPLTTNGCPVDPPPPDSDGDGVPDTSDACAAAAGPGTADGCPDIARTLSLAFRRGAFRGTLGPAGPCSIEERVTVYRKKRGRDPRVGSDRTDARGKFLIGATGGEGTYYAKVPASERAGVGHCLAVRSKNKPLAAG